MSYRRVIILLLDLSVVLARNIQPKIENSYDADRSYSQKGYDLQYSIDIEFEDISM